MFSAGAFFTTYEGTKALLTRLNPTLNNNNNNRNVPLVPTPVIHSVASSTGELVSCLILTPAEVLKQNAQVVMKKKKKTSGPPSSSKVFDGTATILALRKFRSPAQLWRGYSALAARNLPFTAMHFPLFEHVRSVLQTRRERRGTASGTLVETAAVTALAAGSAGLVAAVLTTPVDVVKTRIMLGAGAGGESASSTVGKTHQHAKVVPVQQVQAQGQGKDVKEATIERAQRAARQGRAGGWAVGKEILRTEGVRGLFRGGALRAVWTALGSGLYLAAYESGKRLLKERRGGGGGAVEFMGGKWFCWGGERGGGGGEGGGKGLIELI